MQCLMDKDEDWTPEADDEDFELQSKRCFLSGISRGPPDEFDIDDLEPARHGVKTTLINNTADGVRSLVELLTERARG